MKKYIDAEKLRALLDEKWKELADKNVKVGGGKWDVEISTYLSILRLIDSLQQEPSEVDLEKETKLWWKEHLHLNPENQLWMDAHQSVVLARHFYELGLNARKEE